MGDSLSTEATVSVGSDGAKQLPVVPYDEEDGVISYVSELLSDGAVGLRKAYASHAARPVQVADSTRGIVQHTAEGVCCVGAGLIDGAVGLVAEPIAEIAEDGVFGVIPGVGKGVLTAVCAPVAGALDATALVIKGTAETIEDGADAVGSAVTKLGPKGNTTVVADHTDKSGLLNL